MKKTLIFIFFKSRDRYSGSLNVRNYFKKFSPRMTEVERLSNGVNIQLLDDFAGFKEKKESLRHLLCI